MCIYLLLIVIVYTWRPCHITSWNQVLGYLALVIPLTWAARTGGRQQGHSETISRRWLIPCKFHPHFSRSFTSPDFKQVLKFTKKKNIGISQYVPHNCKDILLKVGSLLLGKLSQLASQKFHPEWPESCSSVVILQQLVKMFHCFQGISWLMKGALLHDHLPRPPRWNKLHMRYSPCEGLRFQLWEQRLFFANQSQQAASQKEVSDVFYYYYFFLWKSNYIWYLSIIIYNLYVCRNI